MNYNILITSAGRRTLLVQAFQRELQKTFPQAKVFAADMNPALSSACHAADAGFSVPASQHPDYPDALLALCQQQGVGLVIPTFEAELPVLAGVAERFEQAGITLLISSLELVAQCVDKRLTNDLFARHGVATPRLIDPRQTPIFPLIAKPYDGYCSHGLRIINQPGDLTDDLLDDPRIVFFEFLDHDQHSEYTVDMYYDRGGRLRCAVPRLRIETRAGEVSKGRTCRLEQLGLDRPGLLQVPGARGCLTAQFFLNRQSGELLGIEINPRFGGGFPLSYEAGANYPLWIIQEYFQDKEVAPYDGWTNQLTMLRYDAHVLVPGAAA